MGTIKAGKSAQQQLLTQLLNSLSRFTDSLSNPQLSVPVSSPANVWSSNSTVPVNSHASVNTTNVSNAQESIGISHGLSQVPEICYKEVLPYEISPLGFHLAPNTKEKIGKMSLLTY